jgi:pyridoxamine 5'-phosphate oxidase
MSLKNIRREYTRTELSEANVNPDPIGQFADWLRQAVESKQPDATAMTLSTASTDGKVSSRIVLLKESSREGFDFFTNYNSKKGRQLRENRYASLLFFWPAMERQIRIEGKVIKLTATESDEYFNIRPIESRISAWASPQSTIVPGRKTLKDWYEEFEEIFKTNHMTRPQYWGGYRLVPEIIEFWQGRENRLHDRLEFTKEKNGWSFHRLAP